MVVRTLDKEQRFWLLVALLIIYVGAVAGWRQYIDRQIECVGLAALKYDYDPQHQGKAVGATIVLFQLKEVRYSFNPLVWVDYNRYQYCTQEWTK
ncbi:MAG TPA: hypothetical protein VGL91_12690 [Acidobacteriota bacterium]